MKFVLSSDILVDKETGFSRSENVARHRCDMHAIGVAREAGQRPYDWDNRSRHSCCLFQYTLEGEGCFQTLPDGRCFRQKKGHAFLVHLPSPTRYWLPKGSSWRFIYVILDGDMAEDLVKELIQRFGHRWNLRSDHAAIALMQTLQLYITNGTIPDAYELSSMAYQILMELFRSGPTPDRHRDTNVKTAMKLIEDHFDDPSFSMDYLEKQTGCSRYHLSRLFRRDTGLSPYAYLIQVRMNRALHWVTNTRMPIKAIAYACGFRDTAHFCREFKRRTHKTPTERRLQGASLNLTSTHVASPLASS